MQRLDFTRRFWFRYGLCVLIAGLILLGMPPEKTLGPVIKLVYLHGALSRAGMIGFWAAGLVAAAYLLQVAAKLLRWSRQAPSGVMPPHFQSLRSDAKLLRWSRAFLWSGWLYWVAHFLVSMPATRLTWGPWVAWGEPRVTMTLQVIAVGLVVIAADRLLDNRRFAAIANLLLAVAVFALVERTGVLRHPLDPIGGSPSATLRVIYLALLAPIVAGMGLLAGYWARNAPDRQTVGPTKSTSQES